MTEQYSILNPDNFIQGGLIDDFDGIIKTARWVSYDYGGKSNKPALALHIAYQYEGGEHDEYYSCGDLERLRPNPADGGKTLLPSDGHIVISTNAGEFLKSIVGAGFPKTKLANDISVFDGTCVHTLREIQAERKGLKNQEPSDKGPKTILKVKTILSMPWEKSKLNFSGSTNARAAGAPRTSTAAGAPAQTQTAAPTGDLTPVAERHVLGILGTNGGTLNKNLLPAKLFESCTQSGEQGLQTGIMNLAFRNEWLGAAERPWKFDIASNTVSLG